MGKSWVCLVLALFSLGVGNGLPDLVQQGGTPEIPVYPPIELISNELAPNMQLGFTISRQSGYAIAGFYEWNKLEQGMNCKSEKPLWSLKTSIMDLPPLIAGYDGQDSQIVQVQKAMICFLEFDATSKIPKLIPKFEIAVDNSSLLQEYDKWQTVKFYRPVILQFGEKRYSFVLVQSGNSLVLVEKSTGTTKTQNLSGSFSHSNTYFVSEAVNDSFYFFEYSQTNIAICYMMVSLTTWPSAKWLESRTCSSVMINPSVQSSFAATYSTAESRFKVYILNQKRLYYYVVEGKGLTTVQDPVTLPFDQLWRGDQIWLGSLNSEKRVNMLSETPSGNLEPAVWINSPIVRQLTFLSDGSALVLSEDGLLALLSLSIIDPRYSSQKAAKYIDRSNIAITFDARFNSTVPFISMMMHGTKKMVLVQIDPSKMGLGECGDYILPVSCQALDSANNYSDLSFIQLLATVGLQKVYAQQVTVRIFSQKFKRLDIGTYVCVAVTCLASLLLIIILFFFLIHGKRSMQNLDAETSF